MLLRIERMLTIKSEMDLDDRLRIIREDYSKPGGGHPEYILEKLTGVYHNARVFADLIEDTIGGLKELRVMENLKADHAAAMQELRELDPALAETLEKIYSSEKNQTNRLAPE